jgi:hypothetical protein
MIFQTVPGLSEAPEVTDYAGYRAGRWEKMILAASLALVDGLGRTVRLESHGTSLKKQSLNLIFKYIEAALAFEFPLFEYLSAAPQMSEGDISRSIQVLHLSGSFCNLSIEARYTSKAMKSKHEISTTSVGVDSWVGERMARLYCWIESDSGSTGRTCESFRDVWIDATAMSECFTAG